MEGDSSVRGKDATLSFLKTDVVEYFTLGASCHVSDDEHLAKMWKNVE